MKLRLVRLEKLWNCIKAEIRIRFLTRLLTPRWAIKTRRLLILGSRSFSYHFCFMRSQFQSQSQHFSSQHLRFFRWPVLRALGIRKRFLPFCAFPFSLLFFASSFFRFWLNENVAENAAESLKLLSKFAN